MFVVTGASGKLGRAIVHQLAQRVPVGRLVAVSRNPAALADLAALGVDVRQGDFADPPSLASAFEGTKQLLLISSNAKAYGGDSLGQHRVALAAARDAGVERVVYTSHMAVSHDSAFPPMHEHAATEDMLRASGLSWTALRNGFYGSSGLAMLAEGMRTGAFDTAADGPVSWAAHADLAEAAARVLIDTSRENGPTSPLTGPEALDLSDLAAIASSLMGKPVVRCTHPVEALRARLEEKGLPPAIVAISLGFYEAARQGEFSTVDPALERLLGRPPSRMRDLIAQQLGS